MSFVDHKDSLTLISKIFSAGPKYVPYIAQEVFKAIFKAYLTLQ
jgi:hypothetical protein